MIQRVADRPLPRLGSLASRLTSCTLVDNPELEALRKELARVKEERDILKKVVGVFSKRPG